MLTNSHSYTRYYAQPLSVSHSFLPPVSLFRPPLQVDHSFSAAPHPSQPTVASWREEDLTVFVPSFGIPTLTRRDWFESSQSFADHKLRLLATHSFLFATQVDNHNPAAGSGLGPRTSPVPVHTPAR
ncbi:hypothetical protein FJTKL_11840 [Diaporthe vaccinii]|uniref:Uncharacterized protein n=1 Tax=Diaporthe vaccinii TaxID=105482 RepID=A0ABR4EFF8_9PEZI